MNKDLFSNKHLKHYEMITLIEALAVRKRLAIEKLPTKYGIELGSLYWPTPLSVDHLVAYADFRTKEESLEFYHDKLPGSDQTPGLVDVDLIWPLNNQESYKLDFFISNHVLEHMPDPVVFFKQVATILRPGGVMMLTIPNADKIYDKHRPRATVTDLISAHANGDLARAKILEYIIEVEKIKDPDQARYRQGVILNSHDDPHLWTFDNMTYAPVLEETFEIFNLPFKINSTHYSPAFEEIIAFIEKT